MTPDIQKSILRACARFIGKTVEPIEKRLTDMETKGIEIPLDGVVKEILSAEELKTLVDLHVAEAVTKHFEANPIPVPKDGKSPDPVSEDQISAQVEQYLKANPPKPGADGVGLAGAMIDRDGELTVTKTNGEAIKLGKVVGDKGLDGADFSDVEFDYDGERGLIIRGKHGEITKRLPIPIDRGYWREGTVCEKGDVLTHDGSAWIALQDTDTKPGHDRKELWRMMARKGRDGDPGKPGTPPPDPNPIKLGNGNG